MQNEHLITEKEYNEIFSKTEQDLYQAYLQKREVEGWKKVLPNTELNVDNIQTFIEKATEWNGGEIYTWHSDGMNGKFGLDEDNQYDAKSNINWEELIQYLKENEEEIYNLHVYGDYASIEFDVSGKGVEISGFNDINFDCRKITKNNCNIQNTSFDLKLEFDENLKLINQQAQSPRQFNLYL